MKYIRTYENYRVKKNREEIGDKTKQVEIQQKKITIKKRLKTNRI